MLYGRDKTIHGTRHVHVEVGPDGRVCAVWFRCVMLPFEEVRVDAERAAEMRAAYASPDGVELDAVEVELVKRGGP